MSKEITGQPTNLEEAVNTLIAYYADDIPVVQQRTEEEFVTIAHFAAGTFIRNNWCLFWNEENRHPAWPKEKPPLVQWFNERGIIDADDMSDEMLRVLWKKARHKQ